MPRSPRKSPPAAPAASDAEQKPRRRSKRAEASAQAMAELLQLSSTIDGYPFPRVLPLLPIRDQVYFPHMIFPLLVGREKSVRALEDAAAQQRYIFIVAQKNLNAEDPDPDDIFTVGIAAEIMQILRVPDGTVRVMLEGLARCRIA